MRLSLALELSIELILKILPYITLHRSQLALHLTEDRWRAISGTGEIFGFNQSKDLLPSGTLVVSTRLEAKLLCHQVFIWSVPPWRRPLVQLDVWAGTCPEECSALAVFESEASTPSVSESCSSSMAELVSSFWIRPFVSLYLLSGIWSSWLP